MELIATLDADPRHTFALRWHEGKLYSGGQGKQVVEWTNLEESRRFAEHGASVNRIDPVAGGFVTCSSDHTVRRWSWDGAELWQIPAQWVRVGPRGLLVTKKNGRVIETDLDGNETRAYPKTEKICRAIWADEGFIAGTRQGLYHVTDEVECLWDAPWVTEVGKHPEGWFAAQHEGVMRIYDDNWKMLREKPVPGKFLTYHGSTAIYTRGGQIHYGDDSYDVGLKGTYNCCINEDGTLLANAAADGKVRVFKL